MEKEPAFLKPDKVCLTKVLNILPSFGVTDHGEERQEQDV
jgi:hypothetical protein